ncbi:threonine synthase [Puia sp.]|jgi:threonine synthase|uniref:threonine synthase n=1 Tax=Puia sp. TaxID=2045100 RepID=UPI002F408BB9
MQYYSLNNPSARVSFKEATIRGQAPDKGLYFPERIPALPDEIITNPAGFSREELAFRVIQPYVGNTLPEEVLRRIVAETIRFDFPLVPLTDTISSLELFHGPTLAFKDVGARFMSRCLGHFVRGNDQPVTVLVATSGDTGGAVASGFYDVEGIQVVILYPSGKVSSVQELQLTTLGKNITALEVDGSFDDCQQMVKEAFADPALNKQRFLTSANSINVARWLPQQFYYFFAWQQWNDKTNPPVISVPSGNFGNICAGLMAHSSGLPVKHFIAACNANSIVTDYLQTGDYKTRTAIPTLSNAMDVGNPSNFVRILEIFQKELPALKKVLSSVSITDEETRRTIRDLYTLHQYLPDPHGAVGYLALERYLSAHPGQKGFFLETAHPVKFYDTVEPILNEKIPLPPAVAALLDKPKHSKKLSARYSELKEFLLSLM